MLPKKKVFILLIIFFSTIFLYYESIKTQNFSTLEDAINVDNLFIEDDINPYCNGINYSDHSDLTFKDIKSLNINIPKSDEWYKNLINLIINKKGYIENLYKNTYPSKVKIVFNSSEVCSFSAEVRIHGDWKDHINVSNLSSSLDVKLIDGNILGITRFKLFLPNSRNNDNEIFVTTFMSELGYLSPRTSYIDVNINGQTKSLYIFQEKLSKEMLEYNGYREGPLIESEGIYFWNTENKEPGDSNSEKNFNYAKLINSGWGKRSAENTILSLEAIEKYNNAIFTTPNRTDLNLSYITNDTNNIYRFDAAILALDGSHGLDQPNRKFYFNKIEDAFIPVFWDVNSNFIENKNFDFLNDEFFRAEERQINLIAHASTELLNDLDINLDKLDTKLLNNNLSLDRNEIEYLYEKFKNNLKALSNLSGPEITYQNQLEILADKNYENINLIFLNPKKKEVEICNQYLTDCKVEKNEAQKYLYFDGFELNEKKSYLFGFSKDSFLNIQNLNKSIKIDNFYIETFNNPDIEISKVERTIKVFIKSSEQKVLIKGPGEISNWKIIINHSLNLKSMYRQDSNLLTGCLTIYNLQLKNIELQSKNGFCEDAINIIKSYGDISLITIQNSINDSLDIDFSNLIISKININDSGNDCIDLSNGVFELKNVAISNCGDKGISLGEESLLNVKSGQIRNTSIGIAIKDSSKAEIKNTYVNNSNICYAVYRKKQEFGPASLYVENFKCEDSNEVYVQKGSLFKNEE